MKVLTVLCLRHGNTFESHETPVMVGKQSDLALTEKGKQQATQAARYLQENARNIDAVFYGHLKRQRQTAEILTQQLHLSNADLCEALTEIDYGKWEGLSSEQIEQHDHEAFHAWNKNAIWPNDIFATTEDEFAMPLLKFIHDLYKRPALNTALLISSQGTFRQLLKLNPDLWQEHQKNGTFDTLKIATGGICELTFDGKILNIVRWNVRG